MKQNTNFFLLLTTILSVTFFFEIGNRDYSRADVITESSNISKSKQELEEESTGKTLPPEVQSAVLEAASQQTSRTVASLKYSNPNPRNGLMGVWV